MSLPIDFSKDGKAYGLLFPIGGQWQMSFYTTERGRKHGITSLFELLGDLCPIKKFEFTLKEIDYRSIPVPFIPRDRKGKAGAMEDTVKPDWRPKKDMPKYKDN
jgi:hypothetical protein